MSRVIVCAACQKRYTYRSEAAGQELHCACGQLLVVPAAAPAEEDDLLEFAPAPAPAEVRKPAVDRAALEEAIRNRVGIIPGKTSETRERERLEAHRQEMAEKYKANALRDTVIPLAILAIGIGLLFLEVMHYSSKPVQSFAAAAPIVLFRCVLASALVFMARFVASAGLDVTFAQTAKESALRFIAIAVGPAAIYGILSSSGELGGTMLGVGGSVAVYALLYWLLLKLDLKDTAICVLMTWMMVALANYLTFKLQGAMGDTWL